MNKARNCIVIKEKKKKEFSIVDQVFFNKGFESV